MQKIELVVFDMAGTVVNEQNVVYKTLRKAITQHGVVVSLDFVLEHGAGKEKKQAITDILKQSKDVPSTVSVAKIFADFKRMLVMAYDEQEITSYDGVEDVTYALKNKNIKVGLNTGYSKDVAQLLLDKMDWKLGVEYDVLITSDDVKRGRPAPDMIFEIMNICNIKDASKVVKVGDSAIDIKEGKNAHCGITVGVTTGAHSKIQLTAAKPDYILDSLTELESVLNIN